MAGKKQPKPIVDGSAETRIKEAARTVFLRKGYAAARTRDIAEEAGVNMALLHYYFRSKEKLFEMVMLESLQQFAFGLMEVLNDGKTSLAEKFSLLASRYIDFLVLQPELPFFIISEVRSNPDNLIARLGVGEFLAQSAFMKQFIAHTAKKKRRTNPVQMFISFVGMTIFPFIGKPMLQAIWKMSDEDFTRLMQERKSLIPAWVSMMLEGD